MMLTNIKAKYFLSVFSFAITLHAGFIYAYEKKEYYEPEVYYRNCNDTECEITWADTYENNEEDSLYHVFISETEDELMPSTLPTEYLNTNAAMVSFLSSTQERTIKLQRLEGYVRIISQNGCVFKDIAELIGIDSLPEALASKNTTTPVILPPNWEVIDPYLLPETSSLKPILDKIFAQRRVLKSIQDVREAGFKILFQRAARGLIVAKHPLVRNYLFKMYLDSLPKAEWPLFVKRAKGARMIQEVITENKLQDYVKAPKKFLYKLPSRLTPQKTENVFPKHFVLLVEDMNISDEPTNKYLYAQTVTRGHLRAIKLIIKKCGLSDSHIGNIPFSYDNKIAFVDTEYINTWPVHLEWITNSLKGERKNYWIDLITKE